MKPEVLSSLLVAKVLFERATELCSINDKHPASAGLVLLQDGLELIFVAGLVERNVDQEKSIENFTFDQPIGELRRLGIAVPKSGTVKALNKQRVLVKHYGQVSEQTAVATYFSAAREAADRVMEQVFGKDFSSLFLHELIQDQEIKKFLQDATEALEAGKYFKALVSCRKAIYVAIESDYCIYEWRDTDSSEQLGFAAFGRRGHKAPWYSKNKKWIEEHVRTPFDYVQLDHDKIRQDLLEWGAGTQDFWNLWRLTPEVVRLEKDREWLLKGELKYIYQASTEENARYCLDRAIALLVKKESHQALRKWIEFDPRQVFQVRLKSPTKLYPKADPLSAPATDLESGGVYQAHEVVPGLDGKGRYVRILHMGEREPRFLSGFVEFDDCEIVEHKEPEDG